MLYTSRALPDGVGVGLGVVGAGVGDFPPSTQGSLPVAQDAEIWLVQQFPDPPFRLLQPLPPHVPQLPVQQNLPDTSLIPPAGHPFGVAICQ